MKKSLYAQYVLEREGVSTYEDENFFFTYKVENDEFCVFEMFIRKEFRNSEVTRTMTKLIDQMALESGAKYLVGTAIAGLPNSEKSLSLQFKNGMKLLRCEGNKIILFKEIGNG